MRPLILISNDDGIDSPGIDALAGALEQGAGCEVMVVAPERQRSAMSHMITLHKPLRVVERTPGRFATSGSPVDCVYLGLLELAPRRPALVISGVNDGYNLGSDVFYSGTVAAAVEGGLRGVPSFAISLERTGSIEPATAFATSLANALLSTPLPERTVLNVNVPGGSNGRYRWTCLGERLYKDDVQIRTDPRGRAYYWIGGGDAGHGDMPGSDCEAVAGGIVSVTPLFLDLTCRTTLAAPRWRLSGYELV